MSSYLLPERLEEDMRGMDSREVSMTVKWKRLIDPPKPLRKLKILKEMTKKRRLRRVIKTTFYA